MDHDAAAPPVTGPGRLTRIRRRTARRWRRSDLRAALVRRRLTVRNLDPVTRVILGAAAVYLVLAAVVLVLESRGSLRLVPVLETVNRIVSVRPWLTMTALFTGLAVAQGSAAALALRSSRKSATVLIRAGRP